MTLRGFLLLFVVTVLSVGLAAMIAERFVPAGFERGIVIAVIAGLVVFPTASWAERKCWIKGNWSAAGRGAAGSSAADTADRRTAVQTQERPQTSDTSPPSGKATAEDRSAALPAKHSGDAS